MERMLADACLFMSRVSLFGCPASVCGRVPWGCPGSPPSLLAGHNGLVAVSTDSGALASIPSGGHWEAGLQEALGLGVLQRFGKRGLP